MGWITLILFPIPAFAVLYYFEDFTLRQFLALDSLNLSPIINGLVIGIAYAILAAKIMELKVFKEMPTRIDQVVRSLNLNLFDAIFLSLCAGIGEELLFRMGAQFYLGPLITAVIFVTVHGYINPMNWRKSLYGIVVLPLALVLGYGMESYGLWFSIAAHFSYDLVLFTAYIYDED